jgi:hypothetical protein
VFPEATECSGKHGHVQTAPLELFLTIPFLQMTEMKPRRQDGILHLQNAEPEHSDIRTDAFILSDVKQPLQRLLRVGGQPLTW